MLTPKTFSRRVCRNWHRNERGQTLILFVAVFTVILAMAAFAIDQGMWLGKRRVSQKDADTAARGGAMAYLADYSAFSAAEAQARLVADQNLAGNDVNTTFTAKTDCTDYKGSTATGVHSLEAQISEPQGSLFSRAFGITSMSVGALATACVGQPSSISGGDSLYVGPGVSSPDPKCFNPDGTPKLGSICPLLVPSGYQDTGSRGLLSLQHDPLNPGNNGTPCTEPSGNYVDQQFVLGSPAVCNVGDYVYTKQTTLEGIKADIGCRLTGNSSNCKSIGVSPAPAGEGACDAEFHVTGTQIPPFASTLNPAFTGTVINSPNGVDDFQEVFSKPTGGAPTSLTDTEFLVPNTCNGKPSPRIFNIIELTGPPQNGIGYIKQFATFYLLGCWDLAKQSNDTFTGPIDPFCSSINANSTALVGIFVRAYIPDAGGPITGCSSDACTSLSIVLVK